MDGMKIFITGLKIAAWIAGFVIVPVLTAFGLSKMFGWDYKTILFSFVIFYVSCFLIAFLLHSFKDLIKKVVYEILKEEKLIKNHPKKKRK